MKLSRDQVRRIGRAQRAAHLFHRFAHHPLCDEYAGEVVRFGRQGRVCKGCLMLGSGAVLGVLVGIGARVSEIAEIGIRPSVFGLSVTGSSVLGLSLLGFSLFGYSLISKRLPKLLSRALPGFLGALSIILIPWIAALVPLAILLYRRRGPNRSPCATCPERTRETPCRGYKPIVDAERAFVRLSHRIIDNQPPAAELRF